MAGTRLRRVVRAIDRATGGAGARRAEIILTDDAAVSRLARLYRRCSGPTDVLAFEYAGDRSLAGEIAISLDTAARQARERSVPLSDELVLLCVHGLLHVAGQCDERRDDWCRMRIEEFETLARIL